MANSNYWLSALNTPKSNTPQKLNPFAGTSLPKTGNNAFTNFQFQQLVNNVASKNTTAKPADNIVAPSNTKTLGQQQQEVNQIKPTSTPSAMNFDTNQLQGLNSAYSRQQGGTANADDIKNLEYATARGFKPTTSAPSALPTTPALSTAPTPIQTPTTAPTSPTVAKTSDDAYKEAARAYIASLAPSSDVNSAKQKYADFISSANLGIENIEGQGRGIPLGLVRGQQEKLYNQSQIEAERLQGDVNLATGSQEAQQAQALAGMNLESTLLGQGREQEQSVIDFNNKMLMSGYQPYTGQPGQSAINVQTFIDPNGQERQYIAPTEKTEYKTAAPGSTIYDPNTGEALYTIPDAQGNTFKTVKIDGKDYQVLPDGTLINPDVPDAPPPQATELQMEAVNSANALLDLVTVGKGMGAVGGGGPILRVLSKVWGGGAINDFTVQFDNLKSLLSLENVKYLKGQGQVSDAERKLLADASAKLNLSQSDETFKQSLTDIVNVLNKIETGGGGGEEIKDFNYYKNLYPNAPDEEIRGLIEKYSFNSVGGDTEKIATAIGQFESGGNYNAIGPKTSSGDQAYGKYQIMGNNIPSWSKEILGYSISKEQFLKNPDLQDKIAKGKMKKMYDKYGTIEDVASVWFSGRPVAKAGNAKDVIGTTVPKYVSNVVSIYNKLS